MNKKFIPMFIINLSPKFLFLFLQKISILIFFLIKLWILLVCAFLLFMATNKLYKYTWYYNWMNYWIVYIVFWINIIALFNHVHNTWSIMSDVIHGKVIFKTRHCRDTGWVHLATESWHGVGTSNGNIVTICHTPPPPKSCLRGT